MKRTSLHSIHQNLGAKIVPFGGYEMPVQYQGIIEEHKAVRTAAGIFDVSHMGEFFVKGKDSLSFLQAITVNDVSKLKPGKAQYSAMCYQDGGIVDDLLVYMISAEEYLVVVNASNIDKDLAWMKEHIQGNVELIDRSDAYSLLAVQGPKSMQILQTLSKNDLTAIPYYNFIMGEVAGHQMIVSRTGYTGELGFELYFESHVSETVWNAILEAGKPHGIQPVGLGARDTLRLEMGYCLYGNEIDKTTNPLEAGLGWITKLGKDNFVGKQAIEAIKNDGIKRKLCGLVISEKAVPRHGYSLEKDGIEIGKVTSGTFSPTLEKGIALGYLALPYSATDTQIQIDIRGKKIEAVVVPVPFLKRN